MEKAGSVPKSADRVSAADAGKANKRRKLADPFGADRISSGLMEELFTPYAISEKVWVISRGQWHRAEIVQQSEDIHPENDLTVPTSKVHYPGWSVKYDEWVMHDSVMADTPENAIKAKAENKAEKSIGRVKCPVSTEKQQTTDTVIANVVGIASADIRRETHEAQFQPAKNEPAVLNEDFMTQQRRLHEPKQPPSVDTEKLDEVDYNARIRALKLKKLSGKERRILQRKISDLIDDAEIRAGLAD